MTVMQLDMFASSVTPYMVRVAESHSREQAVHANSHRAYNEEAKSIGRRAAQVLEFFRNASVPMPDRRVMEALGFSDMNAVRPRITELIKAGLLREAGSTTDYITGKRVRLVEAI